MIGALLSDIPRPYMQPSRISGENGGVCHSAGSAGWTS